MRKYISFFVGVSFIFAAFLRADATIEVIKFLHYAFVLQSCKHLIQIYMMFKYFIPLMFCLFVT